MLKMFPGADHIRVAEENDASPSVWPGGTGMVITGSPLKKISLFPSNHVTVGQAPSGVGAFWPVGALMRSSTFSRATIAAPRLVLPPTSR